MYLFKLFLKFRVLGAAHFLIFKISIGMEHFIFSFSDYPCLREVLFFRFENLR